MASSIVQFANGTFDPESHCYKNSSGRVVPSVTQVLDSVGFVDYSRVPLDVLENKRRIGDAAHFAIHLFESNDLDPYSIQEEYANYVKAYMDFRDQMQWEPESTETSGIATAHGMDFAYTWDGFGRLKGSSTLSKYRSVLELKCTADEEPSWKYQLAAYSLTVPKEKDEYIARVAVKLGPDGKYKPFLYDNPRNVDVFLQSLSIVNVKINEGLPWKRERL
jgi:hypothetical protein